MTFRSRLYAGVLRTHRRLFARQQFRRLNVLLFDLGLRGLGILNYENFDVSGERHLINTLLPRWLGDTPTIFDVGANIGSYSTLLLERFPSAAIHAFEPHPSSRESFLDTATSPALTLHPYGLGNREEDRILYDRADQEGSSHASLYPEIISDVHRQDAQAVPVTIRTLDNVCAELGVKEIDFLKIDVEGHEMAVLDGALHLLDSDSIRLIQFEFSELASVSRTCLNDFRQRLPRHRLYRLLPNGLLPLNDYALLTEVLRYQNILAVPLNWPSPWGQSETGVPY